MFQCPAPTDSFSRFLSLPTAYWKGEWNQSLALLLPLVAWAFRRTGATGTAMLPYPIEAGCWPRSSHQTAAVAIAGQSFSGFLSRTE